MDASRRRHRFLRRTVLGAGIALPATGALSNPVRLDQMGVQEGKDIGPALQKALDAGAEAVVIGPGRFRLETPVIVRAGNVAQGLVSRTAGPVIVGAGTKRTVIDCAVARGAAIKIDQEVPYAFTVDGYIDGMTLRGVPNVPEQDGIWLSGAWNYLISDVEIIGFSGNGLSAPWREDLRATLEGVAVEAGSTIARKLDGEGFGTGTGLIATMRLYGDGIPPGTTLARFINAHEIELSLPATKSGTIVLGSVGNSDAFQSIVTVQSCRFMQNGGWGIWGGAGLGLALSWSNCEAQLNRKGGVYCSGSGWRICGGAIYDNGQDGGYGLLVDRVFGAPSLLTVDGIEFDSNHNAQVWLKDAESATFTQSRFISHYYDSEKAVRAPVGVVIGDAGGRGRAVRLKFDQCHFRSPIAPAATYSCVAFGKPGTYDVIDFDEPFWITRRPEHNWFASEPHPQSRVKVTQNGATAYVSRLARAAALFERIDPQAIASGRWTELIMQRVAQATGAWLGHTVIPATLRAGSKSLLSSLPSGTQHWRSPQPVVGLVATTALAPGSTISMVNEQFSLSQPALGDGEMALVVGGMMAPYAQLYDVGVSFTVEQAKPGSRLSVALTLDDANRREFAVVLAGGPRETVAVRGTVVAHAAARIGVRLRHEGEGSLLVAGGPATAELRITALE